MTLNDLIPTLQLAIGPVILISGVGLILLSMTNRLGRIIDRSRQLLQDLRAASEKERGRIIEELSILSHRARIVRAGIALQVLCVLFVALLITGLFLGVLLHLEIPGIMVVLFIICMISLVLSLFLFMIDINLSLKPLWLGMPPEVRTGS
jgi:hypothetical protein